MAKQLAIIIDASGSMFHPAGGGSSKEKIIEASESVQYVIDEIQNTAAVSDPWAVSFWYFANTTSGLIGQGNFPLAGDTTLYKTAVANTIEDQSITQAAVGNLTDIFHAVRTVADFMVANPPSGFPAVYKKKIVLFTDGNQTVEHDGLLTRSGYETELGVDISDAVPGAREVLTYQPDAETLGGIVVEQALGGSAPGFTGYVSALRFDARGRLTAVVLGKERAIAVQRHVGRLRRLLEEARDEGRAVSIQVDGDGCLSELRVGE